MVVKLRIEIDLKITTLIVCRNDPDDNDYELLFSKATSIFVSYLMQIFKNKDLRFVG